MDNIEVGQGGIWGAIATAITVGATVAYKAFRKVKEDRLDDKSAARQDDFVDGLIKRLDVLEKRADTFAAERNFAVGQEASLKGEVRVLEARVADLNKSREEAKRLVEQLGKQIDHLMEENGKLREHIEVLEEIIRKKGGGGDGSRPEMHIPLDWRDD